MNEKPGEVGADIDGDFAAAGIARYRDVAKWVVGAVAGVAVVLAAGLQITTVGALTEWELVLAVLAVAGLVGSAVYIVTQALTVMEPLEIRVSVIDSEIMNDLIKSGHVPFGAQSGAEVAQRFNMIIDNPALSDAEKVKWRDKAQDFVNQVALYTLRRTFKKATSNIYKGALIGVAALLLFAYMAHDNSSASSSDALPASPTAVKVNLSAEGRRLLAPNIGDECVETSFVAIAIGGDESQPILVTAPKAECTTFRFSLPPNLGTFSPLESVLTPASE